MNEEQLKIVLMADAQKLKSEVNDAKKSLMDFGDVSEEQMEAFDNHLESAKNVCANAMKAIGAAIVGAIASMVALAESTRELRNNQAKLQTAFENAGASAETATKTYDELYRVLGDDGQATEAAAHLAQLSNNQEELAEWTDICKGIYASFGDSLPIESLTEAANETAKTGSLTGALADALNWAGVSEEDFTKKLEECNDEAEREKLIRSTLNGLYKTSADNYEKNNKAVLEANDAQNRMNKSLAKMGEYMEPVNSAVKDFGATLLEDLEDPMKEITQWLTQKFFPGLKKAYEWIKSNLPAITGLVVGATTAIVAYKTATLLTTLAEEGLTAAVIARTIAQKALNVVMAATPTGLVVAGLSALVAGLVAYGIANKDAEDSAYQLTQAEIELRERTEETTKSIKERQEASREKAGDTLAEAEYTKRLADELLSLADANGKVKETDEARVNFILSELNEALGTEYSLTDGIIKKYGELEENIYKVINAKTAMALAEDYQPAYLEALKEEKQIYADLSAAEDAYIESGKRLQEAKAAQAEAYDLYNKRMADGTYQTNWELQSQDEQRLADLDDLVIEEKKLFDERSKTYEETKEAHRLNTQEIEKFELAQVYAAEGNLEAVQDILYGKGEAYKKFTDTVDEETAKVLSELEEEAYNAGVKAKLFRSEWEKGTEGYTEEMVLEAEQGYEDALLAFATAKADAESVGEDMGDGLSEGLGSKVGGLISKAKSIVNQMINAMRKEADSHSPSRKTMAFGEDMGEGAEIGIENTTKDVAEASRKMVAQSLQAMRGLSAVNFGGLISGSAMSVNTSTMAPRAINGSESTALLDALSSKVGNKTPIILQVDGRTFAQTAIDTINQNTKQAGRIGLNII